jgi:hypothetical protein
MSIRTCLLLTAVLFYNLATAQQTPNSNNKPDDSYLEFLQKKEQEQTEKALPSKFKLLKTINFQLKATKEEREIYEDDIVPWISLENAAAETGRLIDANKIVLDYKQVAIIIDYPLNKPDTFLLTSKVGFSKKSLVENISKRYKQLYREEEESASIKTVPLEARMNLMNRNQTNGRYGIWGHDLSDMALSSIEVYKANNKIYLFLIIES